MADLHKLKKCELIDMIHGMSEYQKTLIHCISDHFRQQEEQRAKIAELNEIINRMCDRIG